MIGLIRPLVVPLLKLELKPPHLPEGQHLVRHLRPALVWLKLKYAVAALGFAWPVVVSLIGSVVIIKQLGGWGVLLVALLCLGLFAFVSFSMVAIRLDFELRHYLIGDRSLRVSQGALTRQEVTLSYANIQNVEVRQGPIARLFGLQSLTVSTAGGGGDPRMGGGHQVTLDGLTDAGGLRELMLSMMQKHKDMGLGGDKVEPAPTHLPLKALQEVRDAAVALRNSVVS